MSETEETTIRCPYCDCEWPMTVDQTVIDEHMRLEHPNEPWEPKVRNYMPPGVH